MDTKNQRVSCVSTMNYSNIPKSFLQSNGIGAKKLDMKKITQLIEQQGEYRILKRLGCGAFSHVYLCCLKENPAIIYAVKIVTSEDICPSEIQSGTTLHHKNIASFKHWIILEDFYLLFYEYVKGPDLQVYCGNAGPISEEMMRIILSQLLDAIEYCHENGIAHRDIKMENIVIVEGTQQEVKLVDFGLCFISKLPKEFSIFKGYPMIVYRKNEDDRYAIYKIPYKDTITEENSFVGTEDYCAPEVIIGAIKDDRDFFSTDIYSLGVVLYICTLGYFPFKDSYKKTLYNIRNELIDKYDPKDIWKIYNDHDFCSELKKISCNIPFQRSCQLSDKKFSASMSDELRDLVLKMLTPIPSERITIKQIREHPWFKRPFGNDVKRSSFKQ